MDIIFINDIRMGNVMIGSDRWGSQNPQFLSISLQLHVPSKQSMVTDKKDVFDPSLAWSYIYESYDVSSKTFKSLIDFTEFAVDAILTKYRGRVSAVRAIVDAPYYFLHATKLSATVLRDVQFLTQEHSLVIHDVRAKTIVGTSEVERREKQDILMTIDINFPPSAAKLRDMDWKSFQDVLVDSVESNTFPTLENLAHMIAKFLWKNRLLQDNAEVKVRAERPGALFFSSTAGAFVIRNARSFEKLDQYQGHRFTAKSAD